MQDRYAGDVGDFLKFGLLRWLITTTPDQRARRLGVVWFRVPDESHNGDGRHVTYLDATSAAGRSLQPLDPDLYARLHEVVASGRRSIAALVAAGVLPARSVSFSRPLTFADLAPSARTARIERREQWLADARAAVADCDVVFVDPDNGLRRGRHPIPSHRTKAEKHVYLPEIGALLADGHSVVAYHHADRSAPVAVQAQRRLADVHAELGVEPVAAVRASRGSTRLFLVIPAADDRHHFEARLGALEQSPWSAELTVCRPED